MLSGGLPLPPTPMNPRMIFSSAKVFLVSWASDVDPSERGRHGSRSPLHMVHGFLDMHGENWTLKESARRLKRPAGNLFGIACRGASPCPFVRSRSALVAASLLTLGAAPKPEDSKSELEKNSNDGVNLIPASIPDLKHWFRT